MPLYFKVWDGNVTDDKTHLKNWMALRTLLGRSTFTYVADSKLCTRENMEFIDSEGGTFVTVMPETRTEDRAFKDWIQTNSPNWIEVLRRKGKRKDAPDSVYTAFESPVPSAEGFRILWILSSEKRRLDEQRRLSAIEKTTERLQELASKEHRNRERLQTRIAEILKEHRESATSTAR